MVSITVVTLFFPTTLLSQDNGWFAAQMSQTLYFLNILIYNAYICYTYFYFVTEGLLIRLKALYGQNEDWKLKTTSDDDKFII